MASSWSAAATACAAVGADFASSQHSRGIAVLGCNGHDQSNDPFFSGQSDWAVWERNLAHDAKKGGHGIYISNGSDWNIVRFNETHSNAASDLEINADPKSACGEAGDQAHRSALRRLSPAKARAGRAPATTSSSTPTSFTTATVRDRTFASVRRSIVRNNIFGPQARHNVTFWQDTENPKLGSSDNKIIHNLFITTGGHGVKFENNSTRNEFANNVLIGVRTDGGKVLPNPSALLMEVDGTVERQRVPLQSLQLGTDQGALARRGGKSERRLRAGLVRSLLRGGQSGLRRTSRLRQMRRFSALVRYCRTLRSTATAPRDRTPSTWARSSGLDLIFRSARRSRVSDQH